MRNFLISWRTKLINKLVMRVFIIVLFLIFNLQSWTKADDIRDFQIEGMSAGDSLLNYFSKKKLKKLLKVHIIILIENLEIYL